MKDKTLFNDEHDIVYYANCPEESCPHDYVGKSGRRVLERVKDHNGRDTSSDIFQHCIAGDHQFVSCDDLRIQSIYFILFYYYFVSFRLTTVVMITQILYKMVSKLFIRL